MSDTLHAEPMNMISTLRQRVRADGLVTISEEEFNQLQAEWIALVKIVTPAGTDLDGRMIAAGMIPLSELLEKNSLGRFSAHAGVTDMESFECWLKMRHEEMLRARMTLELDKQEKDEMFEWYFSYAAALGEVLANYRAATGRNA